MNPFFFRVWEFVDSYFRFMLLSRRKTNLLILTSITYVLLITQVRLSIISALNNYRFPSRYEQLWVDQIFNIYRVESFIIACWNPFPINLVWIYLCWFLFMFCNNKRQCLYIHFCVFMNTCTFLCQIYQYLKSQYPFSHYFIHRLYIHWAKEGSCEKGSKRSKPSEQPAIYKSKIQSILFSCVKNSM